MIIARTNIKLIRPPVYQLSNSFIEIFCRKKYRQFKCNFITHLPTKKMVMMPTDFFLLSRSIFSFPLLLTTLLMGVFLEHVLYALKVYLLLITRHLSFAFRVRRNKIHSHHYYYYRKYKSDILLVKSLAQYLIIIEH